MKTNEWPAVLLVARVLTDYTLRAENPNVMSVLRILSKKDSVGSLLFQDVSRVFLFFEVLFLSHAFNLIALKLYPSDCQAYSNRCIGNTQVQTIMLFR